jgi:PglD N-terminal domain
MKKLIIIGARGFGREVYNLAEQVMNDGGDFVIAGFLDDDPGKLDGMHGYPPITTPLGLTTSLFVPLERWKARKSMLVWYWKKGVSSSL